MIEASSTLQTPQHNYTHLLSTSPIFRHEYSLTQNTTFKFSVTVGINLLEI